MSTTFIPLTFAYQDEHCVIIHDIGKEATLVNTATIWKIHATQFEDAEGEANNTHHGALITWLDGTTTSVAETPEEIYRLILDGTK